MLISKQAKIKVFNMRIKILILLISVAVLGTAQPMKIKTSFQSSLLWRPIHDLKTDAVIIYGIDSVDGKNFEERIKTWTIHGYHLQFMTSISWGNYDDYINGKWDGEKHLQDRQIKNDGSVRMHVQVPYMIPTNSYCKFLFEKSVKRAINAGIDDIILEEPEFYYNCNAEFSNKEKAKLLVNGLSQIFRLAKEYGKSKGRTINCYVGTHSIFNYNRWNIISPEILLQKVYGLDGIIAQVWSDTSKIPMTYQSLKKPRTFENAIIEYESLNAIANTINKPICFLSDPVADQVSSWQDVRKGNIETLVAELMFYDVNKYEIMPWPQRVFEASYKLKKNSHVKTRIPDYYASEILTLTNALKDMPLSDIKEDSVPIILTNEILYGNDASSRESIINEYYNLILPVVKRGLPFKFIYLEDNNFKHVIQKEEFILAPKSIVPSITKEKPTSVKVITDPEELPYSILSCQHNYYMVNRGKYIIAHVMDESSAGQKPLILNGQFVDLLDDNLTVIKRKVININESALLYDMQNIESSSRPKILATGASVSSENFSGNSYSYTAMGPTGTPAKQRIYLPHKPFKINITNYKGEPIDFKQTWDKSSNTLLLSFINNHLGNKATINF